MLSLTSVFGGGRGGGMTNPGIEQRRMGGDRTRAASRFNPASAGAQRSVIPGRKSPETVRAEGLRQAAALKAGQIAREGRAVRAAAQARRQAR